MGAAWSKEPRVNEDVRLYWNDADTILHGGHWWLQTGEEGRRTSLHELVGLMDEHVAGRCVLAHVGFLGQLLDAADELQEVIADGLGEQASRPAAVTFASPVGQTCTELAAAIDAWVYDLARGLEAHGGELGPKATRLILDASQVSVYLRSLVGTHRWPAPRPA
jgi:hypothetical protein